jgi:hypothetical protein
MSCGLSRKMLGLVLLDSCCTFVFASCFALSGGFLSLSIGIGRHAYYRKG